MKNLYNLYTKMSDVKINRNSKLPIMSVKYTEDANQWENEPELMLARGIVIDNKGKIVAKPFTKFFNYNQLAYGLETGAYSKAFINKYTGWPNSKIVSVTNKLDGNLAFLSTYNGKLMGFSGSSTEGPITQAFFKKVMNTLTPSLKEELTNFLVNKTLVFEYINEKLAQHIISYSNEEAYVIGLINNDTFEEIANKQTLANISNHYGLKLVEFLPLNNKTDVFNYINSVKNKEGVVVAFANGLKLKIKTPEYLKSRGISNLIVGTNTSIIRSMLASINSGEIDDVLPYLPPRSEALYNKLNSVKTQYENLENISSILNHISNNMTEVRYHNWQLVNSVIKSTIFANTNLVTLIMNGYSNGVLNTSKIIQQMFSSETETTNLLKISSKECTLF